MNMPSKRLLGCLHRFRSLVSLIATGCRPTANAMDSGVVACCIKTTDGSDVTVMLDTVNSPNEPEFLAVLVDANVMQKLGIDVNTNIAAEPLTLYHQNGSTQTLHACQCGKCIQGDSDNCLVDEMAEKETVPPSNTLH